MEIGYKFFVEIVKMIEVLLKVGMGGGWVEILKYLYKILDKLN